jgi:hypothetical protein
MPLAYFPVRLSELVPCWGNKRPEYPISYTRWYASRMASYLSRDCEYQKPITHHSKVARTPVYSDIA